MTQPIYENKWNAVRLGGSAGNKSGGYNITTTAVSSKWYRRSIEASGQRKLQLRHYYEMDQTSVEISRALDILAEDVSSCNADNEDPFDLVFDENQKYLKSTITLLENAKDIWKDRTKMGSELFNRVRDTLKYGSIFFLKKKDGRLKRIPSERVVGYITDEEDEDIITHYIVDPSIQKLEDLYQHRKESKSFNSAKRGDDSKNYEIHPIDDLLVMKIGDGPYGKSVLDTVYKVWRQMSLLEDAVVIYRVVRAPERRVYYIDVGNLQGPKREQAIEKQRLRLMQKQMNRNNQVETEFDPHSTSEDIFIPTNSQGKGSRVETLQGGCLAMDTKVSLLDGREETISTIAEELKNGNELWTYSTDPKTGKIAPGKISWAGVTQKSAKVVRLTLDNGESVVCTPDHKFPVHGKGFVRADQMDVNESIIPLYRKKEKVAPDTSDYEMVYDHELQDWKFTHRMVSDELRDKEVFNFAYSENSFNEGYNVRHHIDFNRFNNLPSNICFMKYRDHMKLHADFGFSEEDQRKGTEAAKAKLAWMKEHAPSEYSLQLENRRQVTLDWWNSLSDTEKDEMGEKNSKARRRYFDAISEEDYDKVVEHCNVISKKGSDALNLKLQSDPQFREEFCQSISNSWTDEMRDSARARMVDRSNSMSDEEHARINKLHKLKQKVEYPHDILLFIIDMVRGKTTHQVTAVDVANTINNTPEMFELFKNANRNKSVPNWKLDDGITPNMVKKIPSEFGYSSWTDFRQKESLHNHRVISIEYLNDPIEVGTLTIDDDEQYHDYHTFALSCGIFTKNSNIGELGDVTYFLNKLAAGLRIPNSMIDSQTQERNQFSDMRVGQAYQIEIRYLGHVKRIARYIAEELHNNFVWFCSDRGVAVPEGVKLMLNDPNSFSKYKDMEIYQQTLNLASSTTQMPHLSKKFVLKKYMMMDDEELIQNEDMKLAEMGLDDKVIKEMPPQDRDNLIYGDKSKAEAYGLAQPEEQGRYGGF